MLDAAENLEFERAKEYRDQIAHIETVMQKQKIVSGDLSNRIFLDMQLKKGGCVFKSFCTPREIN